MKQDQDDEIFGQLVGFTPSPLPQEYFKPYQDQKNNLQNETYLSKSYVPSISIKEVSDSGKTKNYWNKTSDSSHTLMRNRGRSRPLMGVSGHHNDLEENSFQKISDFQVKELNSTDKFQCHYCQKELFSMNCKFCQGKLKLTTQNNIVKFMEYIMNFKLGLNDEYKSKKLTKKTQPNAFCNDFYKSQIIRNSVPSHIEQSISMDQFKAECSRKSEVHIGFSCDQCGDDPITGIRYHCTDPECENNYDLCHNCYLRKNHRHQLIKITDNGCKKQAQAIQNLLYKMKNYGGRSSMNPHYLKPAVHKPSDKRVYSSSIH